MKLIGIHTYSWSLSELLESGLQPFNIVAGQDGRLYEIRTSGIGTIIVPTEHLRRLDKVPTGFQFTLPKIPGKKLAEAITFFRDYCRNGIELEVMVVFFYDPKTGEYIIDCPQQKVSKGRIDYEELSYEQQGFVEVLQLHSHNTMEAYFSSVDNRDEKRFLLYGVIGQLDQVEPNMKIRAGLNGHFYNLPIDYVFDEPDLMKVSDYPLAWHKRVTV